MVTPARARRRLTGASGPAQYLYTDEHGEPLFRVVRRADKGFSQNAFYDGKWLKGLSVPDGVGADGSPKFKKARSVLYQLPKVLGVAERGGTVWMVEGEKDADRLNSMEDITATTTPGGANHFDAKLLEVLYGVRKVIICYDNDEDGHKHAWSVRNALVRHGIAYQFRRANLDDNKADVSDHLDAGMSLDDLRVEEPRYTVTTAAQEISDVAQPTGEFDINVQPPVFQLALERANQIAAQRGLKQAHFKHGKYEETGHIEFEVSCPVAKNHSDNDRRPSFAIMKGDSQPLLVNCQKGCSQEDIAEALGIRIQDFSEYNPPDAIDAEIEKEAQRIRVRRAAQYLVNSEDSRPLELPDGNPEAYWAIDPPENLFTIEGLHVTGSNTLIVAQYKTGKTSLCINLLRSIANVQPFLGRFDVVERHGRVAYLDYEMQASQFKSWLKAGGEIDLDRMTTPLHLRGIKFPFWITDRRKQFTQWLIDNEVSSLIIDTGMAASNGLVDNWNDNNQMMEFTTSLDTLKEESDVDDLYIVTHTGRGFMEDGQEHARGATRLEDWMDAGWYLTKDEAQTRYLRAMGRGVDMETMALEFEQSTHTVKTTGIGKDEHQIQRGIEMVTDLLSNTGEMGAAELRDQMAGKGALRNVAIAEAIGRGYIEKAEVDRKQIYRITDTGTEVHNRRVTIKNQEESES
jgi:5S rRNA maturation endonuclease (ribonuclease M5)